MEDYNYHFYQACMILDRLQVELCEDTPYEIPSSNETRERILEAMDHLEKAEDRCKQIVREMNDEHDRHVDFIMTINHLK